MGKFNVDNYIVVDESLKDKIIAKSETYGDYVVTKVMTVDFIKACEDKFLSEVYDIYNKFRVGENGFATIRTIELDKKLFGGENGQYLQKFEVYTALTDDNKDWVDPKGYLKKLPVAISKKYLNKLLDKKLNYLTF